MSAQTRNASWSLFPLSLCSPYSSLLSTPVRKPDMVVSVCEWAGRYRGPIDFRGNKALICVCRSHYLQLLLFVFVSLTHASYWFLLCFKPTKAALSGHIGCSSLLCWWWHERQENFIQVPDTEEPAKEGPWPSFTPHNLFNAAPLSTGDLARWLQSDTLHDLFSTHRKLRLSLQLWHFHQSGLL